MLAVKPHRRAVAGCLKSLVDGLHVFRHHRGLADSARMEEDAIQTLGIIGAGQIGTGIMLHTLTLTSKRILLTDQDPLTLNRCKVFMEQHLQRRVTAGRMTSAQKVKLMQRVSMATTFDHFSAADFVLEAVSEDLPTKQSVFTSVMPLLRPHVVMASHTASLSISKLAAATDHPERVLGMHFMHPVQMTQLVEVVPGLDSSETSVKSAFRLAGALGKTAVKAADMPGFISFRVLMPWINEAAHAVNENVGSIAEVDTALRLGLSLDKGPLQMADLIGLDVCLNIMRILQADLSHERFRPCPLLTQYVNAGRLGKKSGRGFYKYDT